MGKGGRSRGRIGDYAQGNGGGRMRVVMAKSGENNKWNVELSCGHKFICDHSVTKPGTFMLCPICEGEEEHARKMPDMRD